MKASDLFIQCLEAEGVEYIFAVPGEENLDLVESLRNSSIKLIVCRHEQAAAFMAATYGRLTGKVGVCMSTLGPGATNLVTGIAYAQLCGIPLLAITGQKAIRSNWQADFQVLNIVRMMEPLTKRAREIVDPKTIPMHIRQSFKSALTERLGAVHLELPEDIASEDVDCDVFRPQDAISMRRPNPEPKVIGAAADLIKSAKKPIIIVSSRGQRRKVHQQLRAFSSQTQIPVIQTQMGKGAFGDDHECSLYSFGIHKKDYVNKEVDEADVIVLVGYAKGEHPPYVWNKKMDKRIIHIDFVPAHVDTYYAPEIEVIGDISSGLVALGNSLSAYINPDTSWKEEKKALEKKLFREGSDDASFPLKPRRIVHDCRDALDKEDIICMDNGIYKMWFARHYKTYSIGTFLIDNALATMGAGMPSAMAAKMIFPKKRILAVCGDGGFMMNSQDLETAVRLKINMVVLILNDNAYGFIKWKQSNYGFTDFGLDLGNPDFVKYAESYGAKGLRVESADDLKVKLEEAFAHDGPVLVECPIDYSENREVWNNELDKLN